MGSRVGVTAERIAAALDEVRRRSTEVLEPVDEADLMRLHSPLMSPLVWDLAHVGNYEDQWLLRALGQDGVGAHYDELYDAFTHPRRTRAALPILGPDAARGYAAEVRKRVLDALEHVDVSPDATVPLLASGAVYGLVVQHEHQHDETMLATVQLMDGRTYAPAAAAPAAPVPAPSHGDGDEVDEVLVPAGPFVMGTDTEPWAYDNERPAHVVDLPAFRIDALPVSNADYAAFVAAGGYDEPRWWTEDGWAWRQEAGLEHPEFWHREGPENWSRVRFGVHEPLPPREPVQHVCWYEADAYARWSGKRLPTETEWEKAASWDPVAGRKRRFPWGDDAPTDAHANLGGRRFRPDPPQARRLGASAVGCLGMVGDVWEWTSSDFGPYPGFRMFPYAEYSEVFFGPEHKVLRGGSWATHPEAVRCTFRNWDYPVRRQIFAGFRCARDA